jgi:transposase
LGSYAGVAPVTWRSGTSIRGDHPSSKGNKILKRALFLSAFAALKAPIQGILALARRRCDTIYAANGMQPESAAA